MDLRASTTATSGRDQHEMLKSVAEIVHEGPKYADLPSRFVFNPHTHGSNAEIMAFLLLRLRPGSVCEVGSWLGASARFLAGFPFVERVICVDHWDRNRVENWVPGRHPEDWMDNMYEYFLANCLHAGVEKKIYPVRRDSVEGAKVLAAADETFDMIYLDAAHATDMVGKDLRNYLPLLRKGGLFCGDDWSFATEPENVRAAVSNYAKELNCGVLHYGNFWWYHF
jgi:predicted O-methyltransferase YrrM